MTDEHTAAPRDERTRDASTAGGRLPTMDEQEWPERPEWPDGPDKWRSWD